MKISLPYGTGEVTTELPSQDVTVFSPRFVPGLVDEHAAFRKAVRHPIESKPLNTIVQPGERVAVVIPDVTRPLPCDRLLPWLIEEIGPVPADRMVIISGSGSHRTDTADELASRIGQEVFSRYHVVGHSAFDPDALAHAGATPQGRTVLLNRHYVEADRRIVLGFIEPHFMAGFSGGYKGVFPALADVDSIRHYHRASVIGDERSTWGRVENNPTQDQIRANGSLLPVDFLINVALNRNREITGYFCGNVLAAHRYGCEALRETAMIACRRRFPIVLTTNSGYPLDQNLYQTVKGISAAAQIVEPDGFVLSVSRCNDGFPAHGNFRRLLVEADSPKTLLATILNNAVPVVDQWQVQLLASILLKAKVGIYSEIPARELEKAHMESVGDVGARVGEELCRRGPHTPIAVLPEGPMTVPYIAE